MSLKCRRCKGEIGEEEVAHLVAVRASGYQLTSEIDRCIIVCGECLGVKEKGFNEDRYVYIPKVKPPPQLMPKEARLLEQVGMGRVYRLPRRAMIFDPLTNTDMRCTDRAYKLLKIGFTKWEVVPEDERIPGGPNAWMRLTDDGEEFLKHGTVSA